MKKKKILKQILSILLIALMLLIINSEEVNATLQANSNTHYTKINLPENWIKNFREMEKTGQAMGLSEELEEDLTSKDNISNNIDVHMMKSTEYGAIAILSASGYGNPSNEQAITSTTGNTTGVMLNIDYWELVAGGIENNIFSGTNLKYYDTYSQNRASARVGDALGNAITENTGCTMWHNAIFDGWVENQYPYFMRGRTGIFAKGHNWFADDGTLGFKRQTYCRGVAISGTGV